MIDIDNWISIKGIDSWMVNFAKLHGKNCPDLFLGNDLGVKKMLMRLLPGFQLSMATPWGSYLTIQLWNQSYGEEAAKMYFDRLESPVGTLTIEADDTHLLSILFAFGAKENGDRSGEPNVITDQCKAELCEYFEGKRTTFDVPIRFVGTPFQQRVWNALLEIPFGETKTYGAQAISTGNPKAVRAVGAANGKNPISIIVPCHRVIGANGTLTGYGGGIERKKWLLDHEQALLEQNSEAK